MIVKMKKISVILEDKEIRAALIALAETGVVHLEHLETPRGEELDLLKEEHARLMDVLNVLRQVSPRPEQEAGTHIKQLFINVATSLQEIQELDERILDYQTQINHWEPWGNFDPQDFHRLEKQGVYVRLYAVPEAQLDTLPDDVTAEVLFVSEGMARVMIAARSPLKLDYDEVVLPECGLREWQGMLAKAREHRDQLQTFVEESAKLIDVFEQRLKRLEDRIAYQQALTGRGLNDELALLRGYCPVDLCAAFEQRARQERWAYVIEDPADEDVIPTLLRNPKWVELISPVFKVVEIIPGYREFDVSLVFLIFFTLFFGILIGDAAYGLIFALGTLVVQKKFGAAISDKRPFILMYLLTGFTFIWGVLTGTFFGQQWLPSSIEPLVPWLNDFENMQLLCFTIALVHLSIAKIWSIVRKMPSITFLSDVGWLLIIWGMFFVANMFVLGFALPSFVLPLFYIGIPLAFVFMVEPKKLLSVAGEQTVPFILGVVGAGTDIVSYIRLFAVGLATVAVADATNSMAGGLPLPFMILVLVIGHSLNLVLAAMAILVHAIRLNVLEFSGQLGMEWSGAAYTPFKTNNHEH